MPLENSSRKKNRMSWMTRLISSVGLRMKDRMLRTRRSPRRLE